MSNDPPRDVWILHDLDISQRGDSDPNYKMQTETEQIKTQLKETKTEHNKNKITPKCITVVLQVICNTSVMLFGWISMSSQTF